MLELNDKIKSDIIEHANSDLNNEVAGIIINNQVFRCRNISSNPSNHFLLSNFEVDNLAKQGQIQAYYHSHPQDGSLHETDRIVSERLNLKSIVYKVKSGNFEEYTPQGIKVPYEGRPFLLGTIDCLALIIDFFKYEFNLDIHNIYHPFRNENWLENPEIIKEYNHKNNHILKDHLIDNGFVEVFDMKPYDILLTSSYKIKCAVHLAIYLPNNQILHHPTKNLSIKEDLKEYYKKRVINQLRHKSMV